MLICGSNPRPSREAPHLLLTRSGLVSGQEDSPNAVSVLMDARVEQSCETLVGMGTAMTVAVLILIAGLGVVLVPLGMLVQQLVFSRAVPILRDAKTMEPPILLLGTDERYHLFLCALPKLPPARRCRVPTLPPTSLSAGATSGAPAKTSAPSSSASSSCCSPAS